MGSTSTKTGVAPTTNEARSITPAIAASISVFIDWYCALRSTKGTFIGDEYWSNEQKESVSSHHPLSSLVAACHDSRWISGHGCATWNVCRYNRGCAHDGALADGHATEYRRAATDAGAAFHYSRHD